MAKSPFLPLYTITLYTHYDLWTYDGGESCICGSTTTRLQMSKSKAWDKKKEKNKVKIGGKLVFAFISHMNLQGLFNHGTYALCKTSIVFTLPKFSFFYREILSRTLAVSSDISFTFTPVIISTLKLNSIHRGITNVCSH